MYFKLFILFLKFLLHHIYQKKQFLDYLVSAYHIPWWYFCEAGIPNIYMNDMKQYYAICTILFYVFCAWWWLLVKLKHVALNHLIHRKGCDLQLLSIRVLSSQWGVPHKNKSVQYFKITSPLTYDKYHFARNFLTCSSVTPKSCWLNLFQNLWIKFMLSRLTVQLLTYYSFKWLVPNCTGTMYYWNTLRTVWLKLLKTAVCLWIWNSSQYSN